MPRFTKPLWIPNPVVDRHIDSNVSHKQPVIMRTLRTSVRTDFVRGHPTSDGKYQLRINHFNRCVTWGDVIVRCRCEHNFLSGPDVSLLYLCYGTKKLYKKRRTHSTKLCCKTLFSSKKLRQQTSNTVDPSKTIIIW